MRNMFMSNTYAAPCKLCGHIVPAGKGILLADKGNKITHERDKNPKWFVQHKKIKDCSK